MIKRIIGLLFLVSICVCGTHFDGVDDNTLATIPNIDVNGRFTCIVWFYPTATGKDLLQLHDGTNYTYLFYNANGSCDYLRASDPVIAWRLVSTGTVVANKWNVAAFGWDGTNMFMCINNNDYYVKGTALPLAGAITKCEVGEAWGAAHFVGEIGQVGIWDRAMTKEQIWSIAQKQFSADATAHSIWIYDRYGLNNKTMDISGNGYNVLHEIGTTESTIFDPLLKQNIYTGE